MPVVQIWDTNGGRQLAMVNASVEELRFVANGSRLMTIGASANGAASPGMGSEFCAMYCQPPEQAPADCYSSPRGRGNLPGRTHHSPVVCRSRANQTRLHFSEIEGNLRAFFDPLKGGPDLEKEGWPYGHVYTSECYQVIESTADVDHVESLKLMILKAPEPKTDPKKPDPSILQSLQCWGVVNNNFITVAPNDLVHLTIKPGDIQVRTTNWTSRPETLCLKKLQPQLVTRLLAGYFSPKQWHVRAAGLSWPIPGTFR